MTQSTTALTPAQVAEDLFGLLRKSAAEADGLEALVKVKDAEIQKLKQASQAPRPVAPSVLDASALTKLANTLEGAELLPLGMTAKEACDKISNNPNILIRWMHNLAAPAQVTEGRAVKAASLPDKKISGEGKIVKLANTTLVDYDGWEAAIN